MDSRVNSCSSLTERDIALLYRIEAGLAITADVSRSDAMLCCLLDPQDDLLSNYEFAESQAVQRGPVGQILVARHAAPHSLSSIYRDDMTGRTYTFNAQPTVHRALMEDRKNRMAESKIPPERTSSGAPVIQQVYTVHNAVNQAIAALLIETNMIEYERHRRRDLPFRHAVRWLQRMAVQGEIETAEISGGFGSLDGIYLVDEQFCISYMSGIAMNLFRSVGRVAEMRGAPISDLEEQDQEIVSQAMQANCCVQTRHESEDGRVWVRTAIPLRAPHGSLYSMRRRMRRHLPWTNSVATEDAPQVDGVFVLVQNLTETVQRERELKVKSAMIQEVHHRVKNNLQTIAAILRIQSRRYQDEEAKQQLTDAVNRILSMSVIHEYLSQDEHRPINIRDVCQRILGQAQQVAVNPGQQVEIAMEGPNIRLPAGQATASALVVNELLMNAMEHGLRDRHKGEIRIALEDLGDEVRITLLDNGLGLPSDFDPDKSRTLGLQIVYTLVTDDLKGRLQFEQVTGDDTGAAEGTRAIVTFPKRSINIESVVA
jgi:two-component sensor histidine kinase